MTDKAHSRGYYGESRIAKLLGGKVVGRSKAIVLESGKVVPITHEHAPDVVTDLFSVESKWIANCPKKVSQAYSQAVANCPDGLIPLLVMRDKATGRKLYTLEEKDFIDLHGS